jgi:hypothetical protein
VERLVQQALDVVLHEPSQRWRDGVREVVEEALAAGWDVGRADGHTELRPVNAFGDTAAAVNPYRRG